MTGEYRVVVRIESAAADAAAKTRPTRPPVPPKLSKEERERLTLIADFRKAGLAGHSADGTSSVNALFVTSEKRDETRGLSNGLSRELGRLAAPTKLGNLIRDTRLAAARVQEFVPDSVATAVKEAAAPLLEKLAPIMKALPQIALVAQAVEGGIGLAASGALQSVAAGITGFLAPNYNPNQAAVSGSGLAALARGMLSDVSLGTGIVTDFLSNLVGSATSADEAAKVFGGELRRSDAGDASRSFADLKQQLAARHKNMEEGLAAFNHGRRLGGAAGSNRGNW